MPDTMTEEFLLQNDDVFATFDEFAFAQTNASLTRFWALFSGFDAA